ncbi:MAG TPA: PilZ domain-containing protein [Xanthobacteraceae bacterium]
MSEHRRFHRIRPSGLIPKTAIMFADLKSPATACTIIDISAGGACIEVHGAGAIPRRFTLNHGGTKKSCSLVWQNGRRIGVSF